MADILNNKYVRFQRGSQEAYDALRDAGQLDDNTLYFIYSSDNKSAGALYMGARFISGGDATIVSSNLDDLADVIVSNAKTNSFLVKDDEGNWIAKSLQDVVALIAANIGDLVAAAPEQVFQVIAENNETDLEAIAKVATQTMPGDSAIVKRLIAQNKYQYTAYVYDGNNWAPMDGNYSALNVVTNEDIQVTTAVGELAKDTTVVAGTTVADLLVQILSKSKNPTKTDPSISAFSVTNNGNGTSFEAGTTITPKWTSSFNKGKYDYKSTISTETIIPTSDNGVVVNSWSVTRDGTEIGTTDNGTGEAFVLEDNTVNFKIIANHSAGNYALTNLNKLPETEVRIAAGSVTKSSTITSYRRGFAGGIASNTEINSNLIRELSYKVNSKPSTSVPFTFNANVGDTKLIFAYPKTWGSAVPKFEYFTMAWEGFNGFIEAESVQVADARGGENGLKEYLVYTYTPATAFEATTQFRVSF